MIQEKGENYGGKPPVLSPEFREIYGECFLKIL